ncbi:MAG: serine/threonine protein kinase, partial [Planctomycetaceae bacterium]|nr:serine/threonine protein kinase [Planctomycetaceae bacterium]
KEPQTFTVHDSLTVENFLGRGCWKDVYKAKQHSTQQFVALKHLREKNDAERASLIREVRTQAALTHQNIPPVFALDILPSGQAIVIEKLVDGSRWSDTIQTRTLDDNLRILLEVANAVAFAHQEHKIVHRDLKPDNVVINDKYDEVYVIDWGLAADVGVGPAVSDERVPHVSQLSSIAGTPLYWAPEQADGTPTRCSPATDVFLLGALLYEILTGYAPYKICDPNQIAGLTPQDIEEIRSLEVGPMLRAVQGIIIPPRLFAPKRYIPEELLAVAMKSLSLLPEDRYTDAGGFIEAVKQYQHFSLITSRCDQNWKQFTALRRERDLTLDQPDALLSLTLRFLETSDVFRSVASEFQLHKIADAVDSGVLNSAILNAPAHPTLISAQRGEAEARTELVALTLRSGDLTLADAQIGLVERNPFLDTEKIRVQRNSIRLLKASRRRARMMKWIAVSLLGIFLGTSTLYSYWINEQYKQTALQRLRAEDNLQKARSAVNTFFTNVAKNPDIKDAGLMQFRRDLLGLARQYHEDFTAQRSDDPDVIAEQVSSLFDMAGIVSQFGEHLDAIDYYRRAIELGNALTVEYPNNDRYLDILAKCYKDLGLVYGKAGYPPEQELENNIKALAINRRLVDEFGDVAEYHRNLARILHNIGLWEMTYGTGAKAEEYFLDSLTVRNGMIRFDDPPEYHYGMAQTHFALALLFVDGERFSEADLEFERASSFLDDLRDLYPERFRNDEINLLGGILFGRGEMRFNEDQPAEALSYLIRAREPLGILVERAPEHLGYQRQLNIALTLVFECLVREGRDDEALELFQQREESLLETAALFPEVVQFLCRWYLSIADFHLKRGQKEEAIQALQDGFEMLDVLDDQRTVEEEELWKRI